MRYLLALALSTIGMMPSVQAEDFRPDPRSVQRYGPAYRYSQAGWIVLHIEGDPYARGVQHGRLLAPEIAAHLRCLSAYYGPKAPAESWKHIRNTANSLFLRRYAREFLEEMKGIADGASDAGARFDGRPVDLIDIVAINSSNELDALEPALGASATGLEGLKLPPDKAKLEPVGREALAKRGGRPMRCNAFAATGPATKDGKLVFGHITMFDLYPANFYNVWIDLKPAKGHRFVMQSYPGGMHSGMDYSINDSGILMAETTLDQTGFDLKGSPVATRIREAIQFSDSIEQAVESLKKDNNGLSTNEWILADLKKNEIALLTLGTRKSKLYRSSKNEWIGNTPGFYWSCNNAKDIDVRLETMPSAVDRPSPSGVFVPSKRDIIWLDLYDRYKGKIDGDFARKALTTPALVAHYSVDAKYTTAELAGQLGSWATFGPPVGKTWQPTPTERKQFPEIQPLVSNPWTVFNIMAPEPSKPSAVPVVDLHDPEDSELPVLPKKDPERVLVPAWHGTLLPRTDADVWLTTAFANYERLVADEKALRKQAKDGKLGPAELDHLGVSLFFYRSIYELGARASEEMPLAKTRSTLRSDDWHKVASGKGVLLLHSLRGLVGETQFDRLMDEFGRANAGKEVTVAMFQAHLEKGTDKRWDGFFEPWLNTTGLPRLELGPTETTVSGKKWSTSVTVGKTGPGLLVPITVEQKDAETSRTAKLEQDKEKVDVKSDGRPVRVIVDKYGLTARGNGGPFTVLTFVEDLEKSLIIYGTEDEILTNREAAEALQDALRRREHNVAVPIKKDSEVTAEEMKQKHLLLIGRPNSNKLTAQFRDKFPVSFGTGSFEVRGEAYAHPDSVVIAAAENPLNRKYSMIVIAGLSGLATFRAVPPFEDGSLTYAEVVVLAHLQEERAIVVPPKELIRELRPEKAKK